MKKQDLKKALQDREDVLVKRYNMYCQGTNEQGIQLSYTGASNGRVHAKKELELCKLVGQLIELIPDSAIRNITYENMNTLYRLIEPTERHRRMYESI